MAVHIALRGPVHEVWGCAVGDREPKLETPLRGGARRALDAGGSRRLASFGMQLAYLSVKVAVRRELRTWSLSAPAPLVFERTLARRAWAA